MSSTNLNNSQNIETSTKSNFLSLYNTLLVDSFNFELEKSRPNPEFLTHCLNATSTLFNHQQWSDIELSGYSIQLAQEFVACYKHCFNTSKMKIMVMQKFRDHCLDHESQELKEGKPYKIIKQPKANALQYLNEWKATLNGHRSV